MRKVFLLIEKDFIFCSKSLRFLSFLAASFSFGIFAFIKVEPAYKEYVIVLASLWILSTALLDLLVYRDIVKNRVSHILAFGFDSFELMLSKSIFMTMFSVFVSFLWVVFFRIMAIILDRDYHSLNNLNFLILIPTVFFIISVSVFLTFRFRISRPIRIVFIIGLLIINEFRELIAAISKSGFVYIGLIAFFIIADIIIIKIMRNSKNEDII
ncbi:MAG TPA: hypothetical protein VK469_01330 [Candidatus Kapabacteria bacterium]|nr:hypothetical protein [Candidatus Kapabacteria bacterium]